MHTKTNFLLTTFFFFFSSLCAYSPSKISYSDHCKSIIAPSTPTRNLFVDSSSSFHFSGYFSGGESLLSPDPDQSPSSSNSSFPAFFYFYTQHLYMTRTQGVIQLDGTLVFEGRTTPYPPMNRAGKRVSFTLSGFWSEFTGELCMVGSDWYERNRGICTVGSGCRKTDPGNSPEHSVVFRLKYPKISNISTSHVNGTVESLDSVDSPSYFDPISVLAYAQMNYSYTMISQVRDSCSVMDVPEESLGLDASTDICSNLRNMLNGRFGLKSEFAPFADNNLGFSPAFMKLDKIECSQSGKIHMYIGFFSSIRYANNKMFTPGKSLVGEGFWDGKKQQLCVLACPILNTRESAANGYVGDCSIGFSFWFPSVFSLRNRSATLGQIWSNKDENDPGYFEKISFRSLETVIDNLSGWRYEYTEFDAVTKSSCAKHNAARLGNKRYPDGNQMNDMRFDITFKDVKGNTMWGFASPLTFGDQPNIYSNSYLVSDKVEVYFPVFEDTNQSFWNVSYRMRIFFDSCLQSEQSKVISAEGIYDIAAGILCMVGCQYPSNAVADDSVDCKILINIQVPPKNPEDGEYLTGKISSAREKADPLYFDPLEISSCKL